MINVEGLSIAFQGEPLFEEASFSIQPRERCGLVGRNGSGKSTLFRLLVNEEIPDSGRISIRKNYSIGFLNQHITFKMPTILEEAALGLRPEEVDCLYKAEKILFGLGFSERDLDASPHNLSGGYQLRLHLAKILISEPDCLLLDEPTNYLDIVSIRWFSKFLKQWQGEFLLISHDREFMDEVTTHTMGIHRKKMRKVSGGTVAFYEQILFEEEVHEKTRLNLEKKRAHAQSFIDRFGAKATKAGQAQSRRKQLDRIPTLEKLMAIHELNFNFNEAPFLTKMMLEAHNVSFSYREGVRLIENLSLDIQKGERIAIVGKNGRGKSTILRLLAQDLQASSGLLKRSENLKIGYFGQTNIDRLHPKHSIEEEISLANPLLTKTEVRGICGVMMFSSSRAEKPTSVLSGGEKSRVLLGKILSAPCNLLLLDEPTHHLDMESIEALIDALEEFQGAVIIVTHSELILKRLALDKILVCREGKQELFLGNYEDFLEKNGWHEENPSDKHKKKKEESKDYHKQHTELTNLQEKALKQIDREISRKEERIVKLESEHEQHLHQLLNASMPGNSQAIQELSKIAAIQKREIDVLYGELEVLIQKREKKGSLKMDDFQRKADK